MRPELPYVADPPDMVSGAGFFRDRIIELPTAEDRRLLDRLEDGAVAVARAPDVVDLTRSGAAEEFPERRNEIARVNVVADLLSLVAVNRVAGSVENTLHEIGQKAVELRTRMGRARQTPAAKRSRLQAEVASIFLRENVRGQLARTEKAVLGAVDRHRLVDSMLRIRMCGVDLPPEFALRERQKVGGIAVNLVRGSENEYGFRTVLPHRLQHHQCAVGVDREVRKGLSRSPVVARLSRRMNDDRDRRAVGARKAIDGVLVAHVDRLVRIAPELGAESLDIPVGRRLRTEKIAPHVVVDSDDVHALLVKKTSSLAADQPAGTGYDRNGHPSTLIHPPARKRGVH